MVRQKEKFIWPPTQDMRTFEENITCEKSRAGEKGSALFTSTIFSWSSWKFLITTLSTASSESNMMNPKPLGLCEMWSYITKTSVILPNCSKYLLNSSSVTVGAKPPTKIFLFLGPDPTLLLLFCALLCFSSLGISLFNST